MFGALLTAGDHKARMDTLLYGTEQEAGGMRAAKRLGSGHVALAKARIAANKKSSNLKALLDAVPRELHSDPGYMFARIQLLRREEKFDEAAQLMLARRRIRTACTISTNGGSSGGCWRARCSTSANIAPPI